MIPVKYKQIIKEGIYDLRYFDFSVFISRSLCTLHDEKLKFLKAKNESIVRYLEKEYKYLIDRYSADIDVTDKESKVCDLEAPIWVFWWQGNETVMPDIIKACLQSKRKAAGKHPIILITKENLHQYITLSENIERQFKEGSLRIQHYADIIRVNLIRKYGGIWLDASIFCSDNVPEYCFNLPFFSLCGERDEKYISENKWTTFAIGGTADNLICSFLSEFFNEYCKSGKKFIDYFMFDCAIALAYRNIPRAKMLIDQLPIYEHDCYWLSENLNAKYDFEMKICLDKKRMPFNKIAWKQDFEKDNTVYSYLIRKLVE